MVCRSRMARMLLRLLSTTTTAPEPRPRPVRAARSSMAEAVIGAAKTNSASGIDNGAFISKWERDTMTKTKRKEEKMSHKICVHEE